MELAADRIISFFVDNFPSTGTLFTMGPLGFCWSMACLYFAGYLKRQHGWKTGYSRKTFHFLTFISVAFIQTRFGTPGVCLFGGMSSLVVLISILLGDGNILYEALAREKDAPHRTYYIVAPYVATLIGGLFGNIVFGEAALFGYLAAGVGDAAGEVIGTRYGKHIYKVKAMRSVAAIRSWEGSAGVCVMCLLSLIAAVWLSPSFSYKESYLILLPLIALTCALVEAFSPHGWDNATMQIVPAALAVLVL